MAGVHLTQLVALLSGLMLAGVFLVPMAPAASLKPQVMGKRGVVAAGHPLVAEAGFRMLQKGGNAVDAGIASVFAAGVVEQMSFGLGGEAPILIKLKGQPVVAINGSGWAPALATADFYRHLPANDPRRIALTVNSDRQAGLIPSYGPLTAIVPGAIDALLLALRDYGTLSFSDVIQPAIELAQGFPVDARLARVIATHQSVIEKWPDAKRVYLPHGRPPEEGEIWSQPDLARTLECMADAEQRHQHAGRAAAIDAVREYFYRGPVAKRISAFCEQAGCLLRESDFAAYHAQVEPPVTTNYRGIDVYKAGFWTQGPVMIENLNLLEGFDLKRMGHNSPAYVHTVVEAMKLGYADRDAYYGDPEFSRIPQELLSKDYARLRRPLIDPHRASAEHIPGDPEQMKPKASAEFTRARFQDRNAEHQDTTCVNAIDRDGNTFSATPSGAWVPAMLAGDTGIPLSERANQFVLTPGHPNQIAPHKRPRLTLTPSIALRHGEPFLAFSTPGGDSQDQTLLQIFLNVVEFGMGPQEAVEAPRFNSLGPYNSFDDHTDRPLALEIEKRIPEPTLSALRALGHQLIVQGDWGISTAATMIEFDPANGVIKAGADVRGGRYAIGW